MHSLSGNDFEKGYAPRGEKCGGSHRIGLFGQGAYICNKAECILKLNRQKLLNRAFSADVPKEVYAGIEEEFFGKR